MSKMLSLALISFFCFTGLLAQSKSETIHIKTSAVCEMCETTIEKALSFEKGVKKAELNVETSVVTVTYDPRKTTPEKLRLAIANSGYDADEVMADPAAYDKLHACCKKDSH